MSGIFHDGGLLHNTPENNFDKSFIKAPREFIKS